MSRSSDIVVRMIAEDAGLREALQNAGNDGERALRKLDQSAKKAEPSLKSVDNVAKDIKNTANDMVSGLGPAGSALRGLGPIGIAAGAGLAAIAAGMITITRLGGQAAQEVATIGDAADEVSLTADAYQGLVFMARENRIAQSDLDSAMRTANKTLAEAALGTGEFYSNMNLLNPELVEQIRRTDSYESRLRLVIDALKNARSETEFNTLAVRTFGDNGVRTAQALTKMDGGLDDVITRAKEMGAVIDQSLIRASQEAASEIDAANLRIERSTQRLKLAFADEAAGMKTAWADLIDFIARTNDPTSGMTLAESIDYYAQELEEARTKLIDMEARGDRSILGTGLARQRAEVAGLKQELEEARALQARIAADGATPTQGGSPSVSAELLANFTTLQKAATSASDRRAEAEKTLNEAIDAGLVTGEAEIARLRAYVAETYKTTQAVQAKTQAEREAAAELQRATREARAVRESLFTTDEKIAARQARLNELVAQGGLAQADADRALVIYRQSLDGTADAIAEMERAITALTGPQDVFDAKVRAAQTALDAGSISLAEHSRLLAEFTRQRDAANRAMSDQSERDNFGGETLEEAESRIRDSLKTAEQIIDEKIVLQEKIIAALGQSISGDDAAQYLANYRQELEGTVQTTERLTAAQTGLETITSRQIRSWGDLRDAALDALQSMIVKTIEARAETSKLGSGLQGVFGGLGNIFGSLFSGGTSAPAPSTVPVLHSGIASVGQAPQQTRRVSMSIFNHAPRLHAGANLGADEVPAILQTRERVLSRVDNKNFTQVLSNLAELTSGRFPSAARASVSGTRIFIQNFSGEPVTRETRTGAGGDEDIMIRIGRQQRDVALTALSGPDGQRVMQQVYGIRPSVGRR